MYTATELETLEHRKTELCAQKADLRAALKKKYDDLFREEFNTQITALNQELEKISQALYSRKHYVKKHGDLKISSRKDWTPEQLREYNRIKKQESRSRKTSKGE